jgi:hypothetical protein
MTGAQTSAIARTTKQTKIALNGRATGTGLELPRGLGVDDWSELGKTLAKIDRAYRWWVGDWLNYGERAYGKTYRQAAAITGLEEKTLRNIAWVAARVEMSRRRDNLSWSHHAEVAALSPTNQDAWLAGAVGHKWTRKQLREQLQPEPDGRDRGDDDQALEDQALEEVAALVGVSAEDVRRLDRVADEAPDLHKRIEDGELEIDAAYAELERRPQVTPARPSDGFIVHDKRLIEAAGSASRLDDLPRYVDEVLPQLEAAFAKRLAENFDIGIRALQRVRKMLAQHLEQVAGEGRE